MAVRLENRTHRYIGLSGDEKPREGQAFDLDGVVYETIPVGSTLLESDTGNIARWNGREWTTSVDPALALLGSILGQLTEINGKTQVGF